MKIAVDTNVLIRAVVLDDRHQSATAQELLQGALSIAIPLTVLCEFAWVLSSGYKLSGKDIARAIRSVLSNSNTLTNQSAVDAGLGMLDAGGDFADGVISFEGEWLGADEFVSFDRKAVKLLKAKGYAARLP